MSGFVGVVQLDGSPVDQNLLQRLVDFQKFRGPDAQNLWRSGHVGLGHTLFKVNPEPEHEHQPRSLDGATWIVADCRVDARLALIAKLQERGHQGVEEAPDAELILRAYAVWADDCVQHLLGDFAFAIWDIPRQHLFCARDQMGVKPFYYAHVGSRVIFSNTLACIRQHPAVSSALNDLAISDFLLFDSIREPGLTSFRDIQRLPPAHTLIGTRERVSTRRYWTLPVSEPIAHEHPNECVEHFRELLDIAVADRLKTDGAGILMSGGLDSTIVAASAQKLLSSRSAHPGLAAYTEVFERLIPHEERHYAGLAAKALRVPIDFHASDDFELRDYLNQCGSCFPEPMHAPCSYNGLHQVRRISVTRRVALTGYGGDPALSSLLTVHFLRLIKNGQFSRALREAARYIATEGRLRRLYIRTRWRRWAMSKSTASHYPEWLNPEMEKRLALRERWEELSRETAPSAGVRPIALEAMTSPVWPSLFESYDSGVTGAPVEVRHPFFDLRLVAFLLALPALPWCSDKEILREAARGALPDAVRLRRKSPLIADPLVALLQLPASAWVDGFEEVPALGEFVQRKLVPRVFRERNAWRAWVNLRPLSLNLWLRSEDASRYTKNELDHELRAPTQETIPKT